MQIFFGISFIILIILYIFWSIISIKDIIEWVKEDRAWNLEGYTVYWIVFTTFVGLIFLGKAMIS